MVGLLRSVSVPFSFSAPYVAPKETSRAPTNEGSKETDELREGSDVPRLIPYGLNRPCGANGESQGTERPDEPGHTLLLTFPSPGSPFMSSLVPRSSFTYDP